MGQSTSSQRDRRDFRHRDSRRFSQLVQDRETRGLLQTRSQGQQQERSEHSPSVRSTRHAQEQELQSTPSFATFSRQISAQSIPAGRPSNSDDAINRDEIFYEQQEVRPLVHMEDLGMRDAPITHITASPMPRRPSVISRLSQRLLPRYFASNSVDGDREGYEEGRSTRRRLSDRHPSNAPEGLGRPDHRRFSLFGPLSPSSSVSSRSRRRRDLAPISRPFPLILDRALSPSEFMESPLQASSPEDATSSRSERISHSRLEASSTRASRLARVRRSISIPLENLLSTTRHDVLRSVDMQHLPQRPSRGSPMADSDYLLPPLSATDPNIDLGYSALESSLSTSRDHTMRGFPPSVEPSEFPPPRAEGSSWTERWADRGSAGRRENRRMPNMLRGRSSRLIRRDDEGPLPRILHLAATAIAAQLSGTPEQAITNMQAVGADGLDGSLNALFRTLQHATAVTGDSRTTETNENTSRHSGTLPPLNFLRVFRFVNQNSDGGVASRPRAENQPSQPSRTGSQSDGSDGRIVTLVVVGVRSVPSENLGHEDISAAEPSLDSLLNLPSAPTNNMVRNGSGSFLRHADGRSIFPHRRRASIGGSSAFPANYDSQRHQRMLNSTFQGSMEGIPAAAPTIHRALSESPPGPYAPPSTPADPGLSAYSSGTSTPNRRPSSASAIQHPLRSSRDMATQRLRETGLLSADDQATRAVRQRRRSDSEFARNRDLGAGAARRNGVVEPDDVESGDSPSHGSRSWLIYVVGTNLSEDHPAFATPSLFTDVSNSSLRATDANANVSD